MDSLQGGMYMQNQSVAPERIEKWGHMTGAVCRTDLMAPLLFTGFICSSMFMF